MLPAMGQGPASSGESRRGLHALLAGKGFGWSILQPGVELEQGVTSVGSRLAPRHTQPMGTV